MKRLRMAKGWSQERFAEEAGIHRTYVSDLERASRNPTIAILDRLATPLEVTASELVSEIDAEETRSSLTRPPA